MRPEVSNGESGRGCDDILSSLTGKISMLKQMLNGLKNGPVPFKTTNFTNLIIWSRITINEVENLKSCDRKKFEDWYEPFRKKLFGERSISPDPLLDYFIKARNQLEHQGIINVGWNINVHRLSIPRDLLKYGPAPQGARGVFVGDQLGGIGWLVGLPNGGQAKYYVNLPRELVESSLLPHNPPSIHMGKKLQSRSAESLAEYYINFIDEMVKSATQVFRVSK